MFYLRLFGNLYGKTGCMASGIPLCLEFSMKRLKKADKTNSFLIDRCDCFSYIYGNDYIRVNPSESACLEMDFISTGLMYRR
jgi:hypothetical protein